MAAGSQRRVLSDAILVSVSGLSIGAIYGMLGVAIVLVMRIARVVNLAQGEFYIVGAFVTSTLLPMGIQPVFAVIAASAVGALLAGTEEVLLLRRMRDASGPILLLATAALAITLAGAQVLLWGTDPRSTSTFIGSGILDLGPVRIRPQEIALVILAVGVATTVWFLLQRSSTGKAMAAVAEDPDAARMIGIDVFRLRLIGLLVAGAVGGLAGSVALPLILVDFTQGLTLSLRGFVAAVVGRTTIWGGLLAGVGLGVMENLAVRFVSGLFRDAVVFAVLVVFVLALPSFGRRRLRLGT